MPSPRPLLRILTTTTPRLLLLSLLFLLPPLYLRLDSTYWKARLHAAASRPHTLASAQALVVSGLSFPRPPPLPLSLTPATKADSPTIINNISVAVCITGHLRAFARPSVRLSIRRHLLHPLRSSAALVDLFFHVGRVDVPRPGTSVSARHRATDAEAALRAEFAPKQLSFFDNTPSRVTKRTCKHASRHRAQLVPPALQRGAECLQIIERSERERGRPYDWVYKTRPDVAFGHDISTPDALRDDTLYVNMHMPGASAHAHPWLREEYARNASVLNAPVGDHVLAAARKVAGVALRADRAFEECGLYGLPKGTINSEVGMTYWLVRNKLRYRALTWFWMLVRDETGPECFRVKWIREHGKEHDEGMMKSCLEYAKTDRIPE